MKKLTALLLVGCMIFSLVGCSKAPVETQAPTEGKTETQAPETQAPTEEAVPEDWSKNPAVDLGGRVIKIGVNWDYVPANSDYVPDPEKDDVEGVNDTIARMKRTEEKYNCKIQYVNVPYDQRISGITNAVMTGDYNVDIIGLDIGQILPLAANGMLEAWDDFSAADDDWCSAQKYTKGCGEIFGKTYATLENRYNLQADCIAVNDDIIASLGLEKTPLELYEAGEWTWDAFLEVCKAATKDTDGDGEVDQFGISGPASIWLNMFVGSNGGVLVDDINGTEMISSPEVMEALEFMHTLYNKEKVAMVVGEPWEWDSNKDAFQQGKSAFYWGINWLMPPGEGQMPWDITIVPAPVGPSSKDNKRWLQSMMGNVIPKGVENPAAVYHVWEDYMMPLDFDFESVNSWTLDDAAQRFTDEGDIERQIDISMNMGRIDLSRGIPGFPINDALFEMITQDKTPAQVVETYKKVAQDAIDAIFKPAE